MHVPSLTGLGERRHLFSGAVNLTTHIDDVAGLIEAEDLSDIVLCGHSYGGMVITGVADRLPDRISAMAYLDAFVPEDGQALVDILPSEHRLATVAGAGDNGGVGVPPLARHTARVPEEYRHHMEARSLQPLATMVERLRPETAILAEALPHLRAFHSHVRPMNEITLRLLPIALLLCSNVFMTFAWYGHLRFTHHPLWVVILASWGIALFEYCLAVPANRYGSAVYSGAELKAIQEVITLVVFAVFAVTWLGERLTLNASLKTVEISPPTRVRGAAFAPVPC